MRRYRTFQVAIEVLEARGICSKINVGYVIPDTYQGIEFDEFEQKPYDFERIVVYKDPADGREEEGLVVHLNFALDKITDNIISNMLKIYKK